MGANRQPWWCNMRSSRELLVFVLCFLGTHALPSTVRDGPLQTAQQDVSPLAGNQEEKPRAGDDYDPCRGLDCASFERMKKLVKRINVLVAEKHGKTLSEEDAPTLFGDIAVTEMEADRILNRLLGNDVQSGAIISNEIKRWTNPVPFYIQGGFPAEAEANIRRCLEYWSNVTCLNFTEYTNVTQLTELSLKYMKFQRNDSGCYAYIGMSQSPGPRIINIGEGCDSFPTVTHEIAHSLGVYHEQSRTDRDDYIIINYDSISDAGAGQFDIATGSTTLDTPYDYGSVMHYGLDYFAKNNSVRSMTVKLPKFSNLPGQNSGPSFYDVKTVNLGYKCAASCPNKTCQNSGIPNPRDCSSCICPEGFGGSTCEDPGPMSTGCTPSMGNIIVSNTSESCLTSPDYPSLAPQGSKCNWILKTSDASKRIEYYFKGDFDVHASSKGVCHQWVELKDGADLTLRGKRACGDTQHNGTSFRDSMVVSFDTFYPDSQSKFQLCYKMKDFDACDYSPCNNGGNCTTLGNDYNCTCLDGYSGKNCSDYSPCAEYGSASPCMNGGVCTDTSTGTGFNCTCPPNYTGDTCETSISSNSSSPSNSSSSSNSSDACSTSPCQNGGACTASGPGYTCACTVGWTGDNCTQDACFTSPCQNGGACTASGSNYTCTCTGGWTGDNCTQDFLECNSNPCMNNGRCIEGANRFTCNCTNTGKVGAMCQLDPPKVKGSIKFTSIAWKPDLEDTESPAFKNQSDSFCKSITSGLPGAGGCKVTAFRQGSVVIDFEVEPAPSSSATALLTTMTTALSGSNSNLFPGQTFEAFTAVASDACTPSPCGDYGTCSLTSESDANCTCNSGAQGTNCTEDVLECTPANPCQNNGTCVEKRFAPFECQCPANITGTTCTEVLPLCNRGVNNTNVCKYNGTCTEKNGIVSCECKFGYIGDRCETDEWWNPIVLIVRILQWLKWINLYDGREWTEIIDENTALTLIADYTLGGEAKLYESLNKKIQEKEEMKEDAEKKRQKSRVTEREKQTRAKNQQKDRVVSNRARGPANRDRTLARRRSKRGSDQMPYVSQQDRKAAHRELEHYMERLGLHKK